MPLVPIYLSSEQIISLHNNLIEVYREEETPIKIEEGLNYQGAIDSICFLVSTDQFKQPKWSHFLERAAYLFYHLNRSHPFTDGNKRTALLATYFFLFWNGYHLKIPKDAHKIILAIADAKRTDVTVEHAYNWILENASPNPVYLVAHLIFVAMFGFLELVVGSRVQDALAYVLYHLRISEMMDQLMHETGLDKAQKHEKK